MCFCDNCLTEKAETGTSSDVTEEKNRGTSVKIFYYCATGMKSSLLNVSNPSN